MIPIDGPVNFPVIDKEADTYFMSAEPKPMINVYSFDTLPELRRLLEERLGNAFTERERLEIAKAAFRSKPRGHEEVIDNKDRDVVDFIYEL